MANKQYPSQTKEATRERVRVWRRHQKFLKDRATETEGKRLFYYPDYGWLWI